jgi:hypothetical protein
MQCAGCRFGAAQRRQSLGANAHEFGPYTTLRDDAADSMATE